MVLSERSKREHLELLEHMGFGLLVLLLGLWDTLGTRPTHGERNLTWICRGVITWPLVTLATVLHAASLCPSHYVLPTLVFELPHPILSILCKSSSHVSEDKL